MVLTHYGWTMEKISSFRRNSVALAGVSLIAAPLAVMATPAFALADACTAVDPGATEVVPGVCELQFVEGGDFTFTAPSGVSKLTAVIVGGGGATVYDSGTYAGGGGAVVYVANVDTSAPVDITVGLGAQSASDLQGGASSVNSDVADGGFTGVPDGFGIGVGGSSGNGNSGSVYDTGGGNMKGSGGGAGAAAFEYSGGVGLKPSEVSNDAQMWPADPSEVILGSGGSIQAMSPGYGDAGWGADGTGQRDYGMDGLVILRWSMSSTLPATGLDSGTFAAFTLACLLPGAALLAFAARSRRAR